MATSKMTASAEGVTRPLVLFLLVQSVLMFWNLGLLTVWTDETFTIDTVVQPVPRILAIVRDDIHPPLYFLLEHFWIQLPLPGTLIEKIRMLSAVWTLLATWILDRFWLRALAPSQRLIALALWTLSPCVLLYGRMGRSYSMQAALAMLAVAIAWRFVQAPGTRNAVLSAATIALLLYTHYVPALAVTAAFGVALVLRRSSKLMLWGALIVIAYLPWLLQFSDALRRWKSAGSFSASYKLTPSVITEHGLKIAYSLVSFGIGETFPVWALIALPLLGALLLLTARRSAIAMIVTGAAVIGYIGVARWVSYPFLPARLLWLLPFLVIWAAVAATERRKLGSIVVALLLAANLASMYSYFTRNNFLNMGYAVPLEEIAETINAAPGLVLLDNFNTDSYALRRYLKAGVPAIEISEESRARTEQALRESQHTWLVHNTHDVSPNAVTTAVAATFCPAGSRLHRRWYMPYEPWKLFLMRQLGMKSPPAFFYEADECTR